MALTPEILAALSAPFAVEEHEFRPKGQNKEKTKQQWLVYIDQVPLIERLNKLTPDYGWEVIMYTEREKYATCHGRLTLCDVSRDGIGGNSPNFDGADADEDTVKGAETDALKRAAVKFGIGLYLREAPAIWVDINANEKDWKRREVAVKVFAEWYAQQYGSKPKLGSGAANGESRRIPQKETPQPANDPVEDKINPPRPFEVTEVVARESGKKTYYKLINGNSPAIESPAIVVDDVAALFKGSKVQPQFANDVPVLFSVSAKIEYRPLSDKLAEIVSVTGYPTLKAT